MINVTMAKAGVAPDVFTYTTLISRLMIEGDKEGARCVVEKDMPAAGVQPNDKTRDTLNLPSAALSKMRAKKLGNWLKQGGDEATNAAWTLLGMLVDRGVANVFNFNVMLKACYSSDKVREK